MLVLIRRVTSHSIKRVYVVTPQRNKDWGRSTVTAFSTKPSKSRNFSLCLCGEGREGRAETRETRESKGSELPCLDRPRKAAEEAGRAL